MIFRKKKTPAAPGSNQSIMRGRDHASDDKSPANADRHNPLARRFQPEDEPETIDLEDPARFHSGPAEEAGEPATRDLAKEKADAEQADPLEFREKHGFLTQDSATGKFHVHPGTGETVVLLEGEPVHAPTELRSGDRIRIGEAEFQFLLGQG